MLEDHIDTTTTEAPDIPAATDAPAPADAQGAQDGQQQEQSEQQQRDEKGRFRGVQARIDELTRARHEAEREAAFWRGRAGGQDGQAQPSATPAAPAKPTPDQFQDYGEYIEALTDWKTEQKVNQSLSAREAEREAAQRQQQAAKTWDERQAATRATLPDYDQVVGGADVQVVKHVAEALLDSDQGPALAYHLAKHPEIVQRLNGLSPTAAAREIGRLEAGLSAQTAAAPAPAKLSNTPPPAGHLKTVAATTQRDPSKMSMDEYKAMRSKQGARWAN